MPTIDKKVYISRRETLKKLVGSGQILLIGNQESSVNFKDNWYPFRQDSTFLYYTGIDQPGLHILIDVDADSEVLYGNELTIDDIVWTGPLPSLQEIAHMAGIGKVRKANDLYIDINNGVKYLPPYRPEHHILLSDVTSRTPSEVSKTYSLDLVKAVVAQRNYKDQLEVAEMEKAVRYSYDMHNAVMKHTKSGTFEHELVGIASKIAYSHNVHFAYPAILTKRGEVLHNHDHHGQLEKGDMVLYDGGCESELHYAGDITRTFPVSGHWSTLQKEMYDIVYNAYHESVQALKPGVPFKDIHLLACRSLALGLKDIGFMKGDMEEAVHEGAHTMFFQCGLGHMIGLDVHDMENLGEELVGYNGREKSKEFGLKSLRLGRALETGFTITVEPGIYIIPALIELRRSQGMYKDFINYDKLVKHSDFGGIRVEDNFLITNEGSKMLGAKEKTASTSNEVEEFMNEG